MRREQDPRDADAADASDEYKDLDGSSDSDRGGGNMEPPSGGGGGSTTKSDI